MGGPIVLFDGTCSLCQATAAFVRKHDRKGRFRCLPAASDEGRAALRAAGLPETPPASVVLVADGRVFTRSAAALRIARGLPFPWRLLWGLAVVPRFLRDPLYDLVARNRHRWLGRR